MFDETAEDLAELDAEVRDQYKPANPTERNLVDTLIHNEWSLRRMRVVEAALWDHAGNIFLAEHTETICNSGHAFTAGASASERLQRVVNSCERDYHRALKELHGLQEAPADTSQLEQSKPTSASSTPFRTSPQPTQSQPGEPPANGVNSQPPDLESVPNPRKAR